MSNFYAIKTIVQKTKGMAADKEVIARTIFREGRDEGSEAYKGIANVINNRKNNSNKNLFGRNVREVCLKKGQFHVWSSVWKDNVSDVQVPPLASEVSNHPDWAKCQALADEVLNNTISDNTKGALYFNQSHGSGVKIGKHWFY